MMSLRDRTKQAFVGAASLFAAAMPYSALAQDFDGARAQPVSQRSYETVEARNGAMSWRATAASDRKNEGVVGMTAFVYRGDLDVDQLTDEMIETVVRSRLSEFFQLNGGGVSLPELDFFVVRGGNPGMTKLTYNVNGSEVFVDRNHNGTNDGVESVYRIDESVSPEVKARVLASVRSAREDIYGRDVAGLNSSGVYLSAR